MNNIDTIRRRLYGEGWFTKDGAYTLFDGQYGSTGKGLLACVIAEAMGKYIDTVTTNAGPNSGHTAYFNGEKIMTQQIPIASVVMNRMGLHHDCYLNGGAIIDPAQLNKELGYYNDWIGSDGRFIVHPAAAVIKPEHQGAQHSDVASTGKGTGPAMAAKIARKADAVFGRDSLFESVPAFAGTIAPDELGRCFVETAQGWSLGINSPFYPYVTSRECSVAQALADLGVSPAFHRKSVACVRTYPIRVGNTPDGFSGGCYPDQEETSFEALGQEPELTTVTKRVRRIFTWSKQQYRDMLLANQPDGIFVNFVNYLPENQRRAFVDENIVNAYRTVLGREPDFVLVGMGAFNEHVHLYTGDTI